MTPAEVGRLAAEIASLTERVGRFEALLNAHMDARALDPGGHLQADDWPEVDEPAPALPCEVAP